MLQNLRLPCLPLHPSHIPEHFLLHLPPPSTSPASWSLGFPLPLPTVPLHLFLHPQDPGGLLKHTADLAAPPCCSLRRALSVPFEILHRRRPASRALPAAYSRAVVRFPKCQPGLSLAPVLLPTSVTLWILLHQRDLIAP